NDTATFTPTGTLVNSYKLTLTASSANCPSVTDDALLVLTDTATIKDTAIFYCSEKAVVKLGVNITAGFNGQWFADAAGTVLPGGTFSSSGTAVSTNPNDTYTLNP